jgi:O-antigen ligase
MLKDDTLAKVVPWLVIISLALFPVGRSAELPLALLALIGLKVFIEKIKDRPWGKASLFFLLFFLCLWVPIVISAPDSYKVSKTSSLAIEYLRFFLSGLAVLNYCLTSKSFKLINTCSMLIVSFWIFDALIQYLFGKDLFGYAYTPQRLNGVFGQRINLGLFLAAYSSFLFVVLYKKKYLLPTVVLNILCVIVLLLAGSRGGWIMYGVVLLGFLAYKWRNDLRMLAVSIGVLIVCLMSISTVLYYSSDGFAARMDTTLEIFKGDEKSIDRAISMRLPIWKTAVAMIEAHPVNGVGGRAFRYAYSDHAEEEDIWLQIGFEKEDKTKGAYHSHQMQLEVLSETGTIGGVLFLAAMVSLFWYWRSRSEYQKLQMLPYALGLAALFFPLNTHYALYSSAWAQVIYWFVPLYFAAGAVQEPLPDAATAQAV